MLDQVFQRTKSKEDVSFGLVWMARKRVEEIERQNSRLAVSSKRIPKIQRVILYDIYSVDQLNALDKGLSRMLDKMRPPKGSLAMIIGGRRSHSEWLRKSSVSQAAGGYASVGHVFAKSGSDKAPVHSISLHLSHLTPSFYCLSLVCRPSKSFQKRYRRLVKGPTDVDFRVNLPNLKYGMSFWRHWWRPGESFGNVSTVKHREIDELMLELNQWVVKKLRKYVGTGLSLHRPLPMIEVLSVNSIQSDLPKDRQEAQETNRTNFTDMLHAIGCDVRLCNPYRSNWYKLYTAFRSYQYDYDKFQLVVGKTELQKLEKKRPDERFQDIISRELRFFAPGLSASLATESLFRHLRREVVSLRNQLSSDIDQQRFKVNKIGGFKAKVRGMARIDSINFLQQRIWSELGEDYGLASLDRSIADVKRSSYSAKEESEITFKKDRQDALESLYSSNQSLLSLIKPAFGDLVSLKHTSMMYRLQVWIAVLTILLLILTFILVPSSVWPWS